MIVTGSLGLAYGYALGPAWGLLTFLVLQGAAAWVLVTTAPVVQVDDRVLRAGRARLPRAYVGAVEVLDGEATRRLRGIDANPYAYHCIRSSVPGAVRVEVSDPDDPHPYWLVSTRDPAAVAAALRGMAR